MSAISIVEDGRYYIKSGYANNGCAHEGKDKHNVEAWRCDAFGNPDVWSVSCDNNACGITQDGTGDFIINDANAQSFVKTSTTSSALKHAWEHADINIWQFLNSSTYDGYKIQSLSDPSQCVSFPDSTDPADGTPLDLRECNDSGDVNPQDFNLIKVQV